MAQKKLRGPPRVKAASAAAIRSYQIDWGRGADELVVGAPSRVNNSSGWGAARSRRSSTI
jgi:hypothetical protein